MKLNKILIVNLDRIGDVVRSTFLFRTIKKYHPHCYLACLAMSPADVLLEHDPYIDTVFTLPHQEIRSLMNSDKTLLHMCFPVFRLLSALRTHNFDLVINPFSDFGAFAARYLKPPYVLGRAMNKEGKFLVHGQETAKFVYVMSNQEGRRAELQHNFSAIYARILRDIEIEITDEERFPSVYVGPRAERFAQNFFKDNGVTERDLKIGFQVGAFTKEKMWPAEHFRALARMLQKEFNAKIVITGSRHEAQTIITTLTANMEEKPVIAAGKTDIIETAAIIKQCHLFVSNDTGPMHIAAALGIPVIALFSLAQSIPSESWPWGEGHLVFAKQNINDISVREVFDIMKNKIQSLAPSYSV